MRLDERALRRPGWISGGHWATLANCQEWCFPTLFASLPHLDLDAITAAGNRPVESDLEAHGCAEVVAQLLQINYALDREQVAALLFRGAAGPLAAIEAMLAIYTHASREFRRDPVSRLN